MAYILIHSLYSLQKFLLGTYCLNLYFVASTKVSALHICSRKTLTLTITPPQDCLSAKRRWWVGMQMKKLIESSIAPCEERWKAGAQTAEGPGKTSAKRVWGKKRAESLQKNEQLLWRNGILNVTGVLWCGGQCNPFRKSNSKNV